jgi:hypothetical protein
MKGTIHFCLEEAVIKNNGQEAWDKIVQLLGHEVGYSYNTRIRDDIDELQSKELFMHTSQTLKMSLTEVYDMFGEHWCVDYSPKVYGVFYQGMKSTRDAITKLDRVHDVVTKHIDGAYPPRFTYEWKGENVLLVQYNSKRNLIDLFIALIKGLDKKFNNQTQINKLDESNLELTFG